MSESTDATGDDSGEFDIGRLATLSEQIGERVTAMKRAIVDDEADDDLIDLAEDLWELLDELEDVLATIDFEELPEAIDLEELSDTIDYEDVPEGLVSEDETAIELTEVREAVHLRELWDAVDLTRFVKEKRELDSSVDDVQDHFDDEDEETDDEGGGEDDGLLEGDLIGNDEEDLIETDLVGGDGEDEEGLLEGDLIGDDEEDDEFFQNVLGTGEGAHVQFDAEARQAYLEEVIQDAVEKFRSALLSTHDKLRKVYKANQEKLGQPGRQPDSLNPTATSTLPPGPEPDSASTRRSTVPAQVRYSKVENPRRIYGRRFIEATNDSRTEPDETAEEADEKSAGEADESQGEADGPTIERRDGQADVDAEVDR